MESHVENRSHENYSSVFHISEDAIVIYDAQTGNIVDVNHKACQSFNKTRTEFLKHPIKPADNELPDFKHTEFRNYFLDARSGHTVNFDWQQSCNRQDANWFEVILKPLSINENPRIVVFFRNITQRKLTEQALKDREEQYRAIFNSSVNGLTLWNAQGEVVASNVAMATIFGYQPEEFALVSPWHIIHPDFYFTFEDTLNRIKLGKNVYKEIKCLHKDGRIIDLEVHGVPMQYRSKPHFLMMAHDVTAKKAAEDERCLLQNQLRQSQKMEAIGQLTGGIAHDFNNILTGIMGYIVLAMEQQEENPDPELLSYLDCAYHSGNDAKELIQQMLTFSRGRHGRPEPVVLDSLIREIETMVRPSLPAGTEFTVRLNRTPQSVMIDPVQMRQVLLNLFINARDATQKNGQIVVSTNRKRVHKKVCTSCQKIVQGDFVELSVSDTGSGIEEQHLSRIFEPFFSTKETGKGSGMGLSMVHGIIHECGGHIVVDSTPNQGSIFYLYLAPTAEKIELLCPKETRLRPKGVKKLSGHVMVVDDKIPVADFLGKLIRRWGGTSSIYHSAGEALGAYQQDPGQYDLIITDQAMPEGSGMDLAKMIQQTGSDIPIVLYTGYGENIDMEELQSHGIRSMLKKPADPDQLFETVYSLLYDQVHHEHG